MKERPFVLLSVAMSADGYVDDAAPGRLVLSGSADLDRVDAERARSDAVMVGAETVRRDNPRLLVRSARRQLNRQAHGLPAQPVKVTVTASGELDPAAEFFASDGAGKLVYAAGGSGERLRMALGDSAEVISMAGDPDRAGLGWVLADLASRGIGRLMIEGGPRLLGQVLAAGLADELQLAVAPVFVADPAAPRLLTSDELVGAGGRMVLAGVVQAGDCAVLRYLLGGSGTVHRDPARPVNYGHHVNERPDTVQDG
jgi:5-amino-6-(5-phosphoribosylamino)uracil reductase